MNIDYIVFKRDLLQQSRSIFHLIFESYLILSKLLFLIFDKSKKTLLKLITSLKFGEFV